VMQFISENQEYVFEVWGSHGGECHVGSPEDGDRRFSEMLVSI
jgi:hypothetical protein